MMGNCVALTIWPLSVRTSSLVHISSVLKGVLIIKIITFLQFFYQMKKAHMPCKKKVQQI